MNDEDIKAEISLIPRVAWAGYSQRYTKFTDMWDLWLNIRDDELRGIEVHGGPLPSLKECWDAVKPEIEAFGRGDG